MSAPLTVLIAPSGFKESLGSDEVADAIAEGVRRVVPDARLRCLPLVDGGEGTTASLVASLGGELVCRRVTGPVGEPVDSRFGIVDDGATAVVEMAAAAGLSLVPRDHRDPTRTTTRGVGELIRAALDRGCRRILVGCGDSGTSDGGAGALAALGARLLDAEGRDIPDGARGLARLDRIDTRLLDQRLAETEILVACNPTNVLTGPTGVARVFGPQKGATPRQVERMAKWLKRWARTLERDVAGGSVDLRRAPGTGASGGLGAGLAAIGATLVPRFEVMLESVDLDGEIARADLVITAEGSIDVQTPNGKIPAEVAARAKRQGKPVLALAGTIGVQAEAVYGAGIDAIQCVLPSPVALPEAFARGAEFVADGAERAMRTVLLGAALRQRTQATAA